MSPTHAALKHAPLRLPLTATMRKERLRLLKRAMLLLILAAQPLGFKVLAEARYEGQNLPATYFRLSTMSDMLSLAYVIVTSAFILAALVHPDRISLGRTIVAIVFTGILLWLDFGMRRMAGGPLNGTRELMEDQD